MFLNKHDLIIPFCIRRKPDLVTKYDKNIDIFPIYLKQTEGYIKK